jgi:N-acetylglucosaminyldiphosphoundecaprenol N-acetyl-beta-D-mannosaminyltransferase
MEGSPGTPGNPRVSPPRANVLGIGVSAINLRAARDEIAAAIASGKKGYICVTGVHGVMEAQDNEKLRRILNGAFLNTPDGMPMVWVGRWQGYRQMERVYGPDLMLALCDGTREAGWTHFLYGGAEGVAESLKERLERRFPGIRIVGTWTPPFRPLTAEEEAELAREIGRVKPDIVWVGLSTPKQEEFMAAQIERLETKLMIGVGAAFDFHSGRVRQAPRWVQRSGLEWLFRLGCEPRRLWRRYLRNNPRFVFRILCQLLGLRRFHLE